VFRLRPIPGAAWPGLPLPQVAQLWAAYLELERTQWLSAAEIEAFQLEQLRLLLKHCFENVPYYRKAMIDAGVTHHPIASWDDFRKLPLLTRELYQANADALKATTLPQGTKPASESFTSGTNGVPIKVSKTDAVAVWWHAFYLRDLDWCGMDLRGSLASIRLMAFKQEDFDKYMAGISVPYRNDALHALMETGPAHGMEIRQDPRKQLEWLRRIQPKYLISLPSNLEFLASLVRESGKPIAGLEKIQCVGEPLPPETKRRIEDGFGVPAKNIYSATEAGYIASECPEGHGLHVHSENVLCEVLDANNRPCRPGETGRLVLTTLHNFLAPFIRYDILDEVTLAANPCPCGRGLPLWTHVDGRQLPFFRLRGGEMKSSQGVVLRVRQVGGFHQFQVVQHAEDRLTLRIAPDKTWTNDHADRVRRVVHEEVAPYVNVSLDVRSTLERPGGGKLKIVVVEVK